MATLASALFIWIYMTGWYVISRVKKRNDIADVAWGLGFIGVAILNVVIFPSSPLYISLLLITVWGIRLTHHIYQRNKDKKEDSRYEQFKQNPYIKVFITQGFFMWLISLPLMGSTLTLEMWNMLGICIWVLGFYFESTADKQLQIFIQNPNNKGKIIQSGLWAYSRHPNYFGEVTMWWGIWLLTLGGNWWTILGPMTITFLILKVSGIPMLEKKMKEKPEFEEYSRRVSIFFPLPPRTVSLDK